ncbi:hypothetical protein KAB70_003298 [Salmonella enterica]|nr:hypothetical protein [Salmonella enterica]
MGWDDTWLEEKKRDAIRPAYAGHRRHHGTLSLPRMNYVNS